MKTLKEMLAEARQVVPEQGPADLKRRLDAGEPVVVVDVRDPDEYRDGHIEDAANISRGFLEFRIGTVAPSPPRRWSSIARPAFAPCSPRASSRSSATRT